MGVWVDSRGQKIKGCVWGHDGGKGRVKEIAVGGAKSRVVLRESKED